MARVKKILLALQDHLNIKNYQDLAGFFEIKKTTIYSWIRRDNIGDTGKILGKLPYLSLSWLETGDGPMMIIDETNKHLIPQSKYDQDTSNLIRPEDAPKRGTVRPPQEKNAEKPFAIADMLTMTTRVLESETVYRSALASNVRAFYQAVINEEEMKTVKEKLDSVTERLERMEKLLESLGATLPEKREQGNG